MLGNSLYTVFVAIFNISERVIFKDFPFFYLALFNIDLKVTYTKAQLALRNGHEREQIWVAYQGLIYDVTNSRLWRNGMHYEHWAGQDLTEEMKDAPHTERVFERFEIVGTLV